MKIRRRQLDAGVPAVAMADIAFNLVLFFIILAKTQDESNLKWEPATVPKVEINEHSRISITVVKGEQDYQVHLNGNPNPIGIASLTPKIEQLIKDDPTGRRTVLLKIHHDTPAATFEPIIEAVSQAGGSVVHVLKKDEQPEP